METTIDRRALLSTLWIVLMLDYIYCDVLGLHDPAYLAAIQSGTVAGIDIVPAFLVGAGVLMQLPIWMVLLSRILPRRINRPISIVAAVVMIVVQIGSLLDGPTPLYVFFSIVEIGLLLAIVVIVATWRIPQVDNAV